MKKSTIKDNKEEKHKKTESIIKTKLSASEIRYRRLFESAKDGILILDAETGKIVDVNPFLMELLGYSKEEFIEKSIWEIGSFQDVCENKEKFLELQHTEYVRYDDLPLVTSDGQKINVEFVSNVYLVKNKKVVQCNIRDITARKKAEAVLEKTRKELAEIKKTADEFNKFTENIIDTVREPLLAIDKDLRIIKASRSFYHFFKVTPEETIGKLIYELGNHQWDIPKLKELLEKIIPDKNSFDNYEVEHHFSTIGKRVMLLNARLVKRAFGKEKVILLAIEDITERKGKENTLKEKHRLTSDFLDSLLNHMHAPIIIWDASMIIKRFNRQFELLSGYDSAEAIYKKIDFLFPKEKMAETLDLLKNHLADEEEIIEIDILTKDNHIKTVLWTSSRIFDEDGKDIIATISQDITNRRQSELALQASEERFRAIFDQAPIAFAMLDMQGHPILSNVRFSKMLGYSKNELAKMMFTEFTYPEDIAKDLNQFTDLKAGKISKYSMEKRYIHKNGNLIWANLFVTALTDSNGVPQEIIGMVEDITERKQAEEKLKYSEEKFKILFDYAPDAYYLSDLNSTFIDGNIAAFKMLGYNKIELIGKSLFKLKLISPNQLLKVAALLAKNLLGKATGPDEFVINHKNGSKITVEISTYPVKIQNQSVVLGIARDITERKRAETELIEAKERAEESDRLKTAFLANMSHEIRTPMNGILGFAELLKDDGLSGDDRQEFIKIIELSGVRLLNIINDIISISKIESNQIEIKVSEVDINKQIEDIYNFFSLEAEKKKLNISFKNGLSANEAIIKTDSTKVYAVLTNLVNNAIKFTQKGSIELGYLKKDGFLEFYVRDTGLGVRAEQKDMIFERFRQGSESRTRNYEGAGLGLSISKAFVEMLGGKIWVENNESNNGDASGATFYFTLPANHIKQSKNITQYV